jgi:hypothetical protein
MRFAMSQVSGRRPDQLRDFMAVLELRAIDFDYCTRVLQQGLGGRLDNPSFSGAGRPQEEKVSDRPAHGRQSRDVSLVSSHDLVNCFVLSNDKVVEPVRQIFRLLSRLSGI